MSITRKGRVPWNKGKRYAKLYTCPVCKKKFQGTSQKTCSIKCAATLRPRPSVNLKGKKLSEKTKKKMSLAHIGLFSGDKHPNWKGGITPINDQLRQSREYFVWRRAVFERDKYTCQECEEVGGRLEAHHLIPFRTDRENYDVSNGLTVCRKCHKKVDNYLNKRLEPDFCVKEASGA